MGRRLSTCEGNLMRGVVGRVGSRREGGVYLKGRRMGEKRWERWGRVGCGVGRRDILGFDWVRLASQNG